MTIAKMEIAKQRKIIQHLFREFLAVLTRVFLLYLFQFQVKSKDSDFDVELYKKKRKIKILFKRGLIKTADFKK